MKKYLIVMIWSVCFLIEPWSQSQNLLTEPAVEQRLGLRSSLKQYAIPAGATLGMDPSNSDNSSAQALLGFQYWEKNKYFISAFYSYAGTSITTGNQSNFGYHLLNPSTNGNAIYASGNYYFLPNIGLGVAGRIGAVYSVWGKEINSIDYQSNGLLIYAVPEISWCTANIPLGKNKDNEFQIGIDVGPSIRWIIGNLAKPGGFIEESEVLGISEKYFIGFEINAYFRLNSIQPYVRISYFKTDNYIDSFSNWQGSIGINILTSIFRDKI